MVQSLGVLSSHPSFERRRVLIWFMVACTPAAIATLFVGILILAVGVASTVGLLLRHGHLVILYGLGSVGFALAFGLTAALATRASRCSMLVEDTDAPGARLPSHLGFAGIWLLFVALGAITWIGPLLASTTPRIKAFIALLSIVPLAFVVAVIFLLPTNQPRGSTKRSRVNWKWLVVFGLLVLMYGATWIQSIGLWIARIRLVDEIVRLVGEVSPGLARTLDPEQLASIAWIVVGLATMVLAPIAAAIVVGISLFCDAMWEARADRLKEVGLSPFEPLLGEVDPLVHVETPRLGLLRRRELNRPDSGAVPEGPKAGDETGQAHDVDLLEEMKKVAQEHVDGKWERRRVTPESPSPLDQGSDALDHFFCGFRPSTDQVQAFRSIHKGFDDAVSKDDPPWGRQTCDCLLTGASGSGRSSVIAAAIVRGVVVRGHTALVIVPNGLKARAMKSRLEYAAAASGVGRFLEISLCDPAAAREWSDPKADAEGGPARTPDVLVATVSEFEEAFFAKSSNYKRLRALLLQLQFIGVDDFDRFVGIERMHLPLVLQKVRITLASEGLHCQTVVAARTMSLGAVELVQQQLLWGNGSPVHLRLQPFERAPDEPEPWSVQLQAKRPGTIAVWEVLERMVAKVAQLDCPALVYAPTISQSEATEFEGRLAIGASRLIRVVIDLDQLDPSEAKGWRGVFHAASDGQSAAIAIRGRATGRDVGVFSVRPATARSLEMPVVELLPLLSAGRDSGLLVAHWRSLVRFLQRGAPVHSAFWARLGLRPLAEYPMEASLRRGFNRLNQERALRLDEPSSAHSRSASKFWPWVALNPSVEVAAKGEGTWVPAIAPVDVNELPDDGREVARVADHGELEIMNKRSSGANSQSERLGSLAQWNINGESTYTIDLAYSNAIRFERAGSIYYPTGIESASLLSPISVTAANWNENNATQASQPLWTLKEICCDERPRFKSKEIGGLRSMICLFELLEQSSSRRARLRTSLELKGLFDSKLEANRLRLQIGYECAGFLLGFGWAHSDLEEAWAAEHAWAALQDPSKRLAWNPELGALLTAVIRKHVPGLEDFVRCIGVDCAGSQPDSTCSFVLCIEPAATAGTAQSLLERALIDETMAAAVVRTMKEVLVESGDPGLLGIASHYLKAGSAFHVELGAAGTLEADASRMARLRSLADAMHTKAEANRGG